MNQRFVRDFARQQWSHRGSGRWGTFFFVDYELASENGKPNRRLEHQSSDYKAQSITKSKSSLNHDNTPSATSTFRCRCGKPKGLDAGKISRLEIDLAADAEDVVAGTANSATRAQNHSPFRHQPSTPNRQ